MAKAMQPSGEGRVKIIGGLIVGLIVVGIIGSAVLARRDKAGVDSSAALPPSVQADFGVPFPGTPNAGAPEVSIYEDFQCPACGSLEAVAGENIRQLAESGKIALTWYPVAFLDDNPSVRQANRDNDNPDSSKRAIAAWGCAIDQGKTADFHDALFSVQPEEGRGYSTQTLKGLSAVTGMSQDQATAYEACVDDQTYIGWARNATIAFRNTSIGGTPSVFVNGEQIDNGDVADQAKFAALIDAATK